MFHDARDALCKNVLRVDAAEPLTEELDNIRQAQATHLVVFAAGECLGATRINDVDSLSASTTFGDLVAGQLCLKFSGSHSVDELCKAFADPNVESLVIQNEQNEFQGVVTRQSLLQTLIQERTLLRESSSQSDGAAHGRAQALLTGEKRILETISTSRSKDCGLTELAEFIESQIEGAGCCVLLISDDGARLRHASSAGLPDDLLQAIDNSELMPSAGACGVAAFQNEAVIVSDLLSDPLGADIRALAAPHGFRACMANPIHSSRGDVLGTIVTYFKHSRSPDDFQKALIDRVLYLATIAIERRRGEDALRDSERRNRALLEGSPVCTKIIDLDSRLQYMSSAGQNQLNICDIESYYGSTFPPDLYPEAWRKPVIERLERAKAGEMSSLECPVLSTDGVEVWFDTTFVPACDEDGRVQYVIVTSVNVTERRKAEEKARQHRDELAHVSRVSTMGELATGIAHELNQPLSAISSYSHVAKSMVDQVPAELPKLKEILGKLETQSIRAGDIVGRLREFVAKVGSKREQSSLNTLVREVVKLVKPDISMADANLKLALCKPEPVVFVDTIQIQQVIVNLIRNAIEAMLEGPTGERLITITTQVTDDEQVEVVVGDTGKGLAQDELEQAFHAFYSTKQAGMGMGLPISRSIVESHGGTLWAESKLGSGATFGFTIPNEAVEQIDPTPVVFIVDDESAMRDSLTMVIEATGVTVKCFASAVEFLNSIDLAATSHPMCLVADIQMPCMDGMELLARLRTLERQIPVILITGHGTGAINRKAEELGAVAMLKKPFRAAELQEIVTATLAKSVRHLTGRRSC